MIRIEKPVTLTLAVSRKGSTRNFIALYSHQISSLQFSFASSEPCSSQAQSNQAYGTYTLQSPGVVYRCDKA